MSKQSISKQPAEQPASKQSPSDFTSLFGIGGRGVDVGGIQGDRNLKWNSDVMRDDMLIVFIVF